MTAEKEKSSQKSPQPPPRAASHSTTLFKGKKRPHDAHARILDSTYYKTRSTVRDIRGHLIEVGLYLDGEKLFGFLSGIEKMSSSCDSKLFRHVPKLPAVLHADDLENCNGAQEFVKKAKLLLELCNQLTGEVGATATTQVPQGGQPCSAERASRPKPHQPHHHQVKAPDSRRPLVGLPGDQDGASKRTYVIGGSAFGWNFVTFPSSSKISYYGRTKDSFRTARASS